MLLVDGNTLPLVAVDTVVICVNVDIKSADLVGTCTCLNNYNIVAAGGRHDYRMFFIYSQEKMWDRYRDYLRKFPQIYELDDAPEEVWELYKDELIQLYAACVKSFFQRASSRNAYCEGVSMLRKLIQYGGMAEVDKIINEQKARTPRRPALIDELSKLEKEL